MDRKTLQALLCSSLFFFGADVTAIDLQRLQQALDDDTTIEEPQRSELGKRLADIVL